MTGRSGARGSRGKVRACIHNADRQTRRASAVAQDSEDSRPRWRTILQTGPTSEDSLHPQSAYVGFHSRLDHGSSGAKWIALINVQYRELHVKA
jgi:hypothetical protein